MPATTTTTTENQSFDASLRELEDIVQSLEQGESSLEVLLDKYERGVKLHTACQNVLHAAELRIEQLRADANTDPAHDTPTFEKQDLPAED